MRSYPQQEAVKFRNNASGLHQAALHLLDLPRPAFLDSSLDRRPRLSKNVNTTRRLLVTRPPRQRPRRIMPVLSHHYVHWHVVFVYENLLHHLALECTGDLPRARR
jgi:hypothetical protein